MFRFKKNLIKSMIKVETISSQPGELKLYAKQITEVEDEYKGYEHFVIEAIKKLPGIKKVSVEYDRGLVTILYNENEVTTDQIYKWIDKLIDITIENKKFIKENWEVDINMVWETLNPLLEKAVLEIINKY